MLKAKIRTQNTLSDLVNDKRVEAKKSVSEIDKIRMNFWFPADFHRQLKIIAAEKKTTITKILTQIIGDYLRRESK